MNFESAASLQYRQVLKQELIERQRRNNRYSLRAFARDLKMSPSHLSSVLNDVDRISLAKANEIAENLGYIPVAKRIFTDLVAMESLPVSAKNQAASDIEDLIKTQLASYELRQDEFNAISGWHHLVLLTAAEINRLGQSVSSIAEKIGICLESAKSAAKRLHRLGLAKSDGEIIQPLRSKTSTSSNVPSVAIQNFHREALQQVTERLNDTPLFSRFIHTTLMAASETRYAEMEDDLETFLNQFIARYGSHQESSDQVYQLSVALLPLVSSRSEDPESLH